MAATRRGKNEGTSGSFGPPLLESESRNRRLRSRPQDSSLKSGTDFFRDDEDNVDRRRFETSGGSKFKKILISIILFLALLAGVAWAGFFFFSSNRNINISDKIAVNIIGPKSVKSGELATYTFALTNNSTTPLGTTSLTLKLGKSFVVSEATPSGNNNTFNLGVLAPNQTNQVIIKGVFLAATGDKSELQATLTYRPGNFNAEFQNIANQTVSIDGSVFDLTLVAPNTSPSGTALALTLKYKNNSPNTFKEVQLRIEYPPNFVPTSSSPAADNNAQNKWTLDQIAAGTSGEITINGSFNASAQGSTLFLANLGFLDETTTFKKQVEAQSATTVGPAGLNVLINISSNSNNNASPNEQLPVSITYQNAGLLVAKDVVITANFKEAVGDKIIDWANLKNAAKGVIQNGTITWSKKQLPVLALMPSQKTGTIDFTLPILNTLLPISENYNYKFEVSAAIVGTTKTGPSQAVTTPTQTIYVVSDIKLNSRVIKNAPATYRITYTLTNTLHDLNNLNLETTLPTGVTWVGTSSTDAGDIRFDSTQNKIIWTLNWLPVGIKQLTLSFDLNFSSSLVPKTPAPNLTTVTNFSATDKINNQPLTIALPPTTLP